MTRLDWTEKEREQNRAMTEMLLEEAVKEQKNECRTTEQFLHSMVMALVSLVNDDMVTEDEAASLAARYVTIYDPNWQPPTGGFEQYKKDNLPLGGGGESE
jgi:hypothetical protein